MRLCGGDPLRQRLDVTCQTGGRTAALVQPSPDLTLLRFRLLEAPRGELQLVGGRSRRALQGPELSGGLYERRFGLLTHRVDLRHRQQYVFFFFFFFVYVHLLIHTYCY